MEELVHYLYLWSCLVGMPYSELASDDFETREKLTQRMVDLYPLSLPMAWKGLNSQDPEIKHRAKIILNKKAKWVLLLNKMDANILDILTRDKYPETYHSKDLIDPEKWQNFCDVMVGLELYDPKKEMMRQTDRHGAVWMMWARAKCVRYGQNPKVGSPELTLIRPGQEPKKKP